jgi:hypothetical protein
MTQEDIIRMAREAGFRDTTTPVVALGVSWEQIQRFAALVAAAEREACARVCEERQEVFQKYYTKGLAAMCAEAIRARSKQ